MVSQVCAAARVSALRHAAAGVRLSHVAAGGGGGEAHLARAGTFAPSPFVYPGYPHWLRVYVWYFFFGFVCVSVSMNPVPCLIESRLVSREMCARGMCYSWDRVFWKRVLYHTMKDVYGARVVCML